MYTNQTLKREETKTETLDLKEILFLKMKTLLLQREDLKNRLEEQVEKGEKRAADQARIAKVPLSSLLSFLLFLSLFLLLYRPPNSDIINFTEIMESILKKISSDKLLSKAEKNLNYG